MKLTPNRRKILEAVLFLIEEGEATGSPLTQYQIVKTLFIADTAHLNTYGRPITFDNYSALPFGPVPQEAYDMLKPQYDWGRHFEIAVAPWARRQVSKAAYQYEGVTRPHDARVLSRSDVKALRAALERVRELGFGGVVDFTHSHPAYKSAWERPGDARSKPIDYALLFDHPDPEGAEELAYASAHA